MEIIFEYRRLTIFVLVICSVMIVFTGRPLIAENGAEQFSDIVEGLKSDDPTTKLSAVDKLKRIRVVPHGVLTTLTELLDDKDNTVRAETMYLLALLGENAKVALPKILEKLKDHSEYPVVRSNAPEAVSKIAPGSSLGIGGLLSVAKDTKDSLLMRGKCLRAIGDMGPKAKSAIPSLSALAKKDESLLVQAESWIAISKIDPSNPESMNVLPRIAMGEFGEGPIAVNLGNLHTGFDVQENALDRMITIGQVDKAIPILIERVSKGGEVMLLAINKLAKLGPAAKPAIPAMIKQFASLGSAETEAVFIKNMLIKSLVLIDPSDQKVIGLLKETEANDSSPDLRKSARKLMEHYKMK